MANQLEKGHQAALVTLKGLRQRVHVAAFHHPGDTVSSVCLREIVEETEARLGCHPRRRTALVRQRIEVVEAKLSQRRNWRDAQRAVILAQARRRKATWERQLQSALEQQEQARRALRQHQQRLAALRAERDALLSWLAQLQVDNATHPNPVRMRWLLDGGFGDAANVTYLVEMGYDLYVIAHNGKTTQMLLKQLPQAVEWTQAGVRTQALDMGYRPLGDDPYPVRLTTGVSQRWQVLHNGTYIRNFAFAIHSHLLDV